MKLIIVDDELLVRKGIATTIEWSKLGIQSVLEANNGEQALKLIIEHKIDIVITDIKMPKMDGLELIEQLKVFRPEAVIIVLSCVNDMESVRKALKFGGALDYIPKLSMTRQELLETVKRALRYKGTHLNEKLITSPSFQLPNFFTLEYEETLRRSIEEQKEKDVVKVMEAIKESAMILQTKWKDSREWEDMFGIFSSLCKKYEILPEHFFGHYQTLVQLLQKEQSLETFMNYLTKMTCDLNQMIQLKRRRKYDDNIDKAVLYIEEHYGENIRLKDIAQYIGVSEPYFSKHFKAIMGINFNDYLTRYKISSAKRLLENKRLSIQDVAEMTGYSNCSYFTQQFREIEGITPKQYQKKSYIESNFS